MSWRLHLGCGLRLIPGWENRDYNRPPAGTRKMDVGKRWPYRSGSAEAIYCEDLFEHLTQVEQFAFLAEALRVLKPGGILRISCPDLAWSLEHWVFADDPSVVGCAALDLARMLYNRRGRKLHKLIPTWAYLRKVMEGFGFSSIQRKKLNETAISSFPGDLRPLSNTTRIPRHLWRPPKAQLIVEAVKPERAS